MQFALNIRIGQSNSRWTTVDDDSDTTSVRFAERGDAKKLAERISHRLSFSTD